MDTLKKSDQQILDFQSFIKKYFDWYEIDGFNAKIISQIGLYATRNPKFNNMEPGWHIDRSLLIWGNPGSGKDEIFRLLNRYLHYLGSPYTFDHRVVWEFAGKFSNKEAGGYHVFSGEGRQNRYYEELAFTDEKNGYPTREVVSHFGNKILIGAELIHITHNAFKNYGIMSHFSTNTDEEKIPEIYGERVYSRLKYMCNFMKLTGKDRRKEQTPVFLSNINQPPAPQKVRLTTPKEHEENKASLEQHYQDYLAGREASTKLSMVYNILVAYDVKVVTEEEMEELMSAISKNYVADSITASRRTPSEREEDKRIKVWDISRSQAVTIFFNRMRAGGAKTIFEQREVEVPVVLGGTKQD